MTVNILVIPLWHVKKSFLILDVIDFQCDVEKKHSKLDSGNQVFR